MALRRRPDHVDVEARRNRGLGLIFSLGGNVMRRAHSEGGATFNCVDPLRPCGITFLAMDPAPDDQINLPLRGSGEDEPDLPLPVADMKVEAPRRRIEAERDCIYQRAEAAAHGWACWAHGWARWAYP